MVQISRSTLQHSSRAATHQESSSSTRTCSSCRTFRRGLMKLLRFLFMSACIPSLFIIRYYWFSDEMSLSNNINININSPLSSGIGDSASASATGSIRSGGGQQQQQTEPSKNKAAAAAAAAAVTLEDQQQRTNMFAFLNDFTSSTAVDIKQLRALVESDIVELDHCRIQDIDINNFTTWAFPLVNDTVTQLLLLYQKEPHHEVTADDTNKEDDDNDNDDMATPVLAWNQMTTAQQDELRIAMQQEFVLQLLEMYAHHAGYCDFSSLVYHPTVPKHDDNNGGGSFTTQRAVTRLRAAEKKYAVAKKGSKQVLLRRDTDDDNENQNEQQQQQQQQLRLVISIMAFKDVEHLRRLVQAVHMPQHYIIIHVEQRASLQFVQAIQQEILNNNANNDNDFDFSNVVLLQFGTIVYRTDSVSMTNLRILRWITLELQLDYDYYVTLDGSSFPLQHAQDLHFALLHSSSSLSFLSEEDNNNEQEGQVRFLDQEESPASNNNNNNGQETTDDDGASLNADDSLQQAHDIMTTTDIVIDDEIENDPATVDGAAGASVWLGSLLHKGVAVDSPQWHLLLQKRLVFTRNNAMLVDRDLSSSVTTAFSYPKLHKRLPRSVFKTPAASSSSANVVVPSEIIRSHMTKKSISGNQGIFRRNVVQQLLTSPDVMELFALSKYACCCCVEERNWIAALGIISKNSGNNDDSVEQQQQQQPGRSGIINYQQEALRQGSTFELWGGEGTACVSSMKNAVLTHNASICYKIDDQILVQAATGSATAPTIAHTTTTSHHYFYGNETWSYLKLAKSKGYFFARKFDSSQPQSMDLLNDIQLELWEEA